MKRKPKAHVFYRWTCANPTCRRRVETQEMPPKDRRCSACRIGDALMAGVTQGLRAKEGRT